MDTTAPAVFDVGFVLLLAAIAGWLARRVGLPAILGYLAVGVIVSPFTPGFAADRQQLQLFADIGVVLLLFEVGIEIDPLRLGRDRGRLFALAPAQIALTAVLAGVVARLAGLGTPGAALVGLSVALSSSVVVVNITRSKRRTTDRHTDESLLGWSVVQDLVGVPLSIVVLILLGLEGRSGAAAILLALAYLALVVAAAGLLPILLRRFREEHDLFLVLTIAGALTLAGIGALVFGIPLALAAFISGLAITESHAAAEARERILPFRDVFAVLFFVGIGALIDPGALLKGLPWLGLLIGLVVAAKVTPVYVLARFGRLPGRPLQIATGLGQIGEFSFVLASIGVTSKLIPNEVYAAMLVCVVITVAASSVLVRLGHPSATA